MARVILLAVVAATTAQTDSFHERWSPADEYAALHKNDAATDRRARVAAETNRSLHYFNALRTPADTEALLTQMLGGPFRDYAVLVLRGEVFVSRKFFAADKVHVESIKSSSRPWIHSKKMAGHAVLLRTAWRRRAYGNVAFLHVEHESGGCPGGPKYPTTVIAKRDGYRRCGVLVPNPYFGAGRGGTGGVLDRWAAIAEKLASKAKKRTQRIAKAFWRGDCHLYGKACEHEAGNRQRFLGASLTSSRPDLFDAVWKSTILLWDTAAVEWYYPGLTAGATHVVVNRSTAIAVVERFLSEPDLVAALSRSAKKVQAELLCADCIADHISLVANLTRERMNYASILDDPDRVLKLARRTGACDAFVRVKVLARSVNQKFAAAGEGLCEMLKSWSRGRTLSEAATEPPFRQRWAPADEFARLHEGHNASERVEAELNRSLQFFTAPQSPEETHERLAEMISSRARVSSTSSRISPKQVEVRGGGSEIRDYAVLVLWGDVFMARPYVSREKGAGHGVLLRTAWQRRPYGNVAFLHLEHESGGDGNCLGGRAERWPTTVIAKRKGYKQCGILVPNPYFGSGGLDGTCGILDRWQAKADEVIAKAKKRPLAARTAKVFWRGDCRLHGKKPCIHEHGNQLRMLGVSLTSRRPDLFDARCRVHRSPYRPPHDFRCVADAERPELMKARSDVLKKPPTTQHVAAIKDFSQWRYVLNLPSAPGVRAFILERRGDGVGTQPIRHQRLLPRRGRTTGSYSRNLNHLWASRSVVLLWDTKVVEWYYPALASGVTHVVVNRSSAIDVVSRLNADPTLVTALSHTAKHVHNDFVSADAIALYLNRVATLTRERMGYAAVLDDAKQLLALAQRTGACDHFVRVDVRDYTVKGSRKYAQAGEGLCEVLGRRASVP